MDFFIIEFNLDGFPMDFLLKFFDFHDLQHEFPRLAARFQNPPSEFSQGVPPRSRGYP